MANLTRIKNNQITDSTVNAAAKLQDYTITSTKISNNLTYGSDLTITGNLTVQGNTTAIDTIDLIVEDPIIILASNQTGSPALDIGFIGERGTSQNIAFVWDESQGEFVTVYTNDTATNTTVTIASYASFHTANANIGNNITVNGTSTLIGNIDLGNVVVNSSKNISMGNNIIHDVTDPVAAQDAATKSYVDGFISGGITIEDDSANTTVLALDGTLTLNGTANEVTVAITAVDTVTFGLPDSVTITANLTVGNIGATGTTTVSGNITGGNLISNALVSSSTLNVSGNANVGNIGSAGIATVTGNITGGNISTGGALSVTGNADVGNLGTTGQVTATGNVTGGNLVTGGQASVTGNITGGNLTTAGTANIGTLAVTGTSGFTGNATFGNIGATGTATVSGNITGGNLISNALISGSTLSVTGNANVGNLGTAGLIVATGNITGGNLTTAGLTSTDTLNVTGNANIGNLSVSANITSDHILANRIESTGNVIGGNIVTVGEVQGSVIRATSNIVAGNANITSAVNAATVVASGNISGGNISAGSGIISTTGNVQGGNIITGSITNSSAITISTTAGNLNLEPAGNIVLNNKYINGLNQPVQDNDAASKIYVDNMVSTQLAYHQAVVAASTGTMATATGGTITYNNGASGVGATLTTTGAFNLIDTANVQTVGTRILIKNEANAAWNGVYTYANTTTVVRSTDTDSYGANATDHLSVNDYFFVTSGSVNAGSAWICDAPSGVITFGTSNISFAQFSSSQTYTAGNGISINATLISAKVDNNTTAFDGFGNIIVKAGANLTTPNIGDATGTSLNLSGNVIAGNLNSNAAVTGTTISASGNVNGGNLLSSGVVFGSTLSISGNANVGNLGTSGLITATGNITGGNINSNALVNSATLNVTGNAVVGNIDSGGTAGFTGNISGGNLNTGGIVNATGNIITGANLLVSGYANVTGNITGGNLTTAGTANVATLIVTGNASYTGNVTFGNIAGTGTATFTGNITGGNLISNALVSSSTLSVSGNANVGNLGTAGLITATGNITGGNLTTAGLTSTGTLSATGNANVGNLGATNGVFTGAVSITGNANVGNLGTAGLIVATGNITGGNLTTAGLTSTGTLNATGNANVGNLGTAGLIVATGNITGGNLITAGLTSTGTLSVTGNANVGNLGTAGLITATGNITGGNLTTAGQANLGNIVISGDNITDTNGRVNFNQALGDVDFAVNGTAANVFYIDAGANTASFGNSTQVTNAIVAFNSATSIVVPTGTTGQRPGVGVTGMVRFNTSLNSLEFYDADSWTTAGSVFTIITANTQTGNGIQTVFTLPAETTTAGTIVAINGVVQIPTTAYSIAGNLCTFTEAPTSSDVIDFRIITTTSTVGALSSTSGALFEMNTTLIEADITGNIIPTANITYNLGNATNRFKDLYLSGSSLYLGNVIMKTATGNTIAFYQPDGVTPATIAASSVDTTQIASGTSSVAVIASNGNIRGNVAGATVFTVSASGIDITGNLSVSGNASLSGNILGDRVQNGTTSIDIQTPSGNANVSVGGVSNVAVFTTTGANIAGTFNVTGNANVGNLGTSGNISAAYLLGNGSQLTGIDATAIQNGTANVRTFNNSNVTVSAAGTANVLVVTSTGANIAGTLNATGNANVGNLGTSGNITAGYFLGNGSQLTGIDATAIQNGTANVRTFLNGNVTLSAAGTANVVIVTSTGANVTGTFNATGNANVGNLGATTVVATTLTGTLSTAAQTNITSVGTLGSLTVTGNISGGNLTVGTGTVTLGGVVNSNANGVGNIGSSTTYFNTVFAKATSAQYADLAEKYTADAEYAPGTVLEFGGDAEVTLSVEAGSTRVAGVVSTNPSYIMNAALEAEHVAMVALQGRVPCKVVGPVRKGDMMVAAGNGAAKVDNAARAGSIIGKALENFDGVEGTIEVVIGRN